MIEDKDIKVGLRFFLPLMKRNGNKAYYGAGNMIPICVIDNDDNYFEVSEIDKFNLIIKDSTGYTYSYAWKNRRSIFDNAWVVCVDAPQKKEEMENNGASTEDDETLRKTIAAVVGSSTLKKPEYVSHPSHYAWLKDLCGVEPLDICRHLDFNVGNAIKYLLRKDKVDGDKTKTEKRIEDLRKAVFYIEDEIKLLKDGKE